MLSYVYLCLLYQVSTWRFLHLQFRLIRGMLLVIIHCCLLLYRNDVIARSLFSGAMREGKARFERDFDSIYSGRRV
jgi:hypothetical protein